MNDRVLVFHRRRDSRAKITAFLAVATIQRLTGTCGPGDA